MAAAPAVLLLLAVAAAVAVSPSLQATLSAEEEAYIREQRKWIEDKTQEGVRERPGGIPYRVLKVRDAALPKCARARAGRPSLAGGLTRRTRARRQSGTEDRIVKKRYGYGVTVNYEGYIATTNELLESTFNVRAPPPVAPGARGRPGARVSRGPDRPRPAWRPRRRGADAAALRD